MNGLPPHTDRAMKRSAASVFFLSLTVFLIKGRAHPEVDCVAAPYVAWSIVRHGSYDVRPCTHERSSRSCRVRVVVNANLTSDP